MSGTESAAQSPTRGGDALGRGFERAARVVGDLDAEFYRDERARDVWNEASAVGYQFLLFASFVGIGVLPWVADPIGVRVALIIAVVVGAASWIVLLYARAHRVDPVERFRWTPRACTGVAVGALAALSLVLALVRREASDGADPVPTLAGAVVGAGLVLVVLTLLRRRDRRREAADED